MNGLQAWLVKCPHIETLYCLYGELKPLMLRKQGAALNLSANVDEGHQELRRIGKDAILLKEEGAVGLPLPTFIQYIL